MSLPSTNVYWHSRGFLPHFEAGEIPQSITFRLSDSLPAVVLQQLENELKYLPETQAAHERRKRIEHLLDQGHGDMHLADARIAQQVENALLHFDGPRYSLHAWTVMPNHVHVLMTPRVGQTMSKILQSWKSFTANTANEILHRQGTFWAPEYHDRYIRNCDHYANALNYIAQNPIKAGLCNSPEDWKFSSFWKNRK